MKKPNHLYVNSDFKTPLWAEIHAHLLNLSNFKEKDALSLLSKTLGAARFLVEIWMWAKKRFQCILKSWGNAYRDQPPLKIPPKPC